MKLRPIYFAVWFSMSVVGQLRADLPPEAQALEGKGIIAAKVPDYPLAIRYFQDARKIAPNSPEIFFNLGLAESRIPGRELRAIAWFGAYLNASPNAANAAAVTDEIAGLQIKNQGNLYRLIKTAQDTGSATRYTYLDRIGVLWAEAGNSTDALNIVNAPTLQDRQFESHARERGKILLAVVNYQLSAKDLTNATRTVSLMKDDAYYSWDAHSLIATFRYRTGDREGAKENIASALDSALALGIDDKYDALASISIRLSSVGDFLDGRKIAELIPGGHQRIESLGQLAVAQARAGDIASAREILASIQKTWDLEPKDAYKTEGDMGGYIRDFVRSPIDSVLANEVHLASPKPDVTITDWLKVLDDNNQYGACPLKTDPFLDLSGYLAAQHSDKPVDLFEAIYAVAEKLVKAQNVIDEMLKQQASQQTKP